QAQRTQFILSPLESWRPISLVHALDYTCPCILFHLNYCRVVCAETGAPRVVFCCTATSKHATRRSLIAAFIASFHAAKRGTGVALFKFRVRDRASRPLAS